MPENSTSFEILEAASFQVHQDEQLLDQFDLAQGASNVFVSKQIGEVNLGDDQYDVKYSEVLIFEFDPSIEGFEYQDEDLAKVNCYYLWRALAKSLIKETIPVKNGSIKGERLEDGRWHLEISIDPKYKVNDSARRIKIDKELSPVSN